VKIIQLNIERDRHLDKIHAFFREENADVLCLQEVNEDEYLHLKEAFGLKGIFVPINLREGMKQGEVLLSKHEMENLNVEYYSKKREELPNQNRGDEEYYHWAFITGEIECGGAHYKVGTTHFPVSYPGTVISDFQRECYAKLKQLLLKEDDLIFCADTNCPRGTELFDDMASYMTDNIPKEAMTTIDKDLHKAGYLPYVVDCIFTTANCKARNVRLMSGVSDHMAIVAEIDPA
jgi:exonuclease III